jgi:hypothetical protein
MHTYVCVYIYIYIYIYIYTHTHTYIHTHTYRCMTYGGGIYDKAEFVVAGPALTEAKDAGELAKSGEMIMSKTVLDVSRLAPAILAFIFCAHIYTCKVCHIIHTYVQSVSYNTYIRACFCTHT